MQTVKDLSIEELRSLIADVLEDKLRELLGDPDEGLELRPEVRERLLKSFDQSRKSRETISAEETARRLGLKW